MGNLLKLNDGRVLLSPQGKPFLFTLASGAQDPAPEPEPAPGSGLPTSDLAGWWDASALPGNTVTYTLTDKSTAGKNASTDGGTAYARMAGALGGLYLEKSAYSHPYNFAYLHPIIGDYAVAVNGITVGSGGALTVFLVWSRANQRQPGAVLSTDPVSLLNIGGVTVLGLTANGDGNDTLTLFPGGAAQAGGKLALRHTHSARVVFSGSTVDVWLDGTKIISGAANQIALGTTANLAFLANAQCVFHEAAAWSRALGTSDHTALTSYVQRWPLGARRAINGVLAGQSNSAKMAGLASHIIVSKLVAYLTGCVSSNLLIHSGAQGQLTGGQTCFPGTGLYNTAGELFLMSSAADASTWPLGINGNSYMAALDSMTADQKANLRYVAWFWSENDSSFLSVAEKPTYAKAMRRAIGLIRERLGMTPDRLPVLVINALPFENDIGHQVHREVMADLVADSTMNVHFMLAQSGDAAGEGDTVDASTGQESGPGNGAHRDDSGQIRYARRFGIPIARAALAANAAAGTPDVVTAIDASVPVIGGPSILSALAESATSVLVTVSHDGGSDLVVPKRAALGVGWAVKSGATVVRATACARVNASQLRLTFPSIPSSAQLYYNYGSGLDASAYAVIGEGNAVTDNFASVTLAAGWRIGADLGTDAQPNFPLQATTYGVPLS